ncbi:MAG: hypothetical protein PHP44_01940, partial [Kiritimatiellae bacterium]|nr:hypothetical protein [Kiritimatiellia bacterium]
MQQTTEKRRTRLARLSGVVGAFLFLFSSTTAFSAWDRSDAEFIDTIEYGNWLFFNECQGWAPTYSFGGAVDARGGWWGDPA